MITSTFTITKADGSTINVDIVPDYVTEGPQKQHNGVYQLFENQVQKTTANADLIRNPEQAQNLGEIAFHLEYPKEWLYTGDFFNEEEQYQIVTHLLEAKNQE